MLLCKIMFYCQACFEFNTSLRYERKYKIRNIKFSRKKQWAFTTMKIRRLVVKLDTEWDFLEWGNKIINTGNKRKERKVRPAFMQKEDCRLLRYSNTWLLWDTIVQIRNKDTHFNWLDLLFSKEQACIHPILILAIQLAKSIPRFRNDTWCKIYSDRQ